MKTPAPTVCIMCIRNNKIYIIIDLPSLMMASSTFHRFVDGNGGGVGGVGSVGSVGTSACAAGGS